MKHSKYWYSLKNRWVLLLGWCFIFTFSSARGKISVYIYDQQSKAPVKGATIFLIEQVYQYVSDTDGLVFLSDTNISEQTNTISAVIYHSDYHGSELSIEPLLTNTYKVFLTPSSKKVLRLTENVAKGKKNNERFKRKVFSREDMRNMATVTDDPVQIVRKLPSTISASPARNEDAVRGVYKKNIYIDNTPVKQAQHVLGLSSIINPELVEYIDICESASEVDSATGDGMVLNIYTRNEIPNKPTGSIDLNLLYLNGYINIPIGKKVSLIAMARRSYFDLILGDVLERATDLTVIQAPYFTDLYGKVLFVPNEHHIMYLSAGYIFDEFAFYADDEELDVYNFGGAYGNQLETFFSSFNYFYTPSKRMQNRVTVYYSQMADNWFFHDYLAYERNMQTVMGIDEHFFIEPNSMLKLYGGISYSPNKENHIWDYQNEVGFKDQAGAYVFSVSPIMTSNYGYTNRSLSAYSKSVLNFGFLEGTVGIRYHRDLLHNMQRFLPRGSILLKLLNEMVICNLHYGRYATFSDAHVWDADNYLASFQVRPNGRHSFETSIYKNRIYKLRYYDDGGTNQWMRANLNYTGVEAQYSFNFNNKITATLSGSYLRATNISTHERDELDNMMTAQLDVGWKINKKIKISISEFYRTGYRYTPISEVINTEYQNYYLYGNINNRKTPPAHYLNLRLDITVPIRKNRLIIGFKVANAYMTEILHPGGYDFTQVTSIDNADNHYRYQHDFPSGFFLPNISLEYRF